jgi:hypothetical protein
MPSPIGWLPFDRNSRWTAAKAAKEFDKEIIIPSEDLIRFSAADVMRLSKMSVDQAIKEHRKHFDNIKELYFRLLDNKRVKSIVWDTMTQSWEWILFSHFGRTQRIMPRDRGAPNEEIRNLINMCDRHLCLVHQSTEIWENDKPTGEFKMAGFPHMEYLVNVCVETGKLTKRNAIKKALDLGVDDEVPPVLFSCRIFNSQVNPLLSKDDPDSTLYAEACSFQQIAGKVYPDMDIELFGD